MHLLIRKSTQDKTPEEIIFRHQDRQEVAGEMLKLVTAQKLAMTRDYTYSIRGTKRNYRRRRNFLSIDNLPTYNQHENIRILK